MEVKTLTDNGTLDFKELDGEYFVGLRDNFGGGTLSVKWSQGGDNYTEFSVNGSYTAADEFVLKIRGDLRFVLSGATNPDLKVGVGGINT